MALDFIKIFPKKIIMKATPEQVFKNPTFVLICFIYLFIFFLN